METAWLYSEGHHPLDGDTGEVLGRVANRVCDIWRQPDSGIWEVRNGPFHFTHSKVLAWVGVDRYLRLKDVPQLRRGQLEALRERIHTTICREGFDRARNSFMQTLDPPRVLDASLLLLPTVGFLPRTHGSALFTRGETQSIVTTTLGTKESEQMIDGLEGLSYSRFMLHYNFPPY